MAEEWDLDGLDDLGDLDDLDDVEEKSQKNKKKKENKKEKSGFSKLIPVFIIIIVLLIIVYSFTSTDNNDNTKDPETETTESKQEDRAELPLINTEQVAWADEVCRLSSQDQWGSSLHNFDSYSDKQYPKTVRDDMADILGRNAYRLGVRSNDLKDLPQDIHDKLIDYQQNTTVADANKKVGNDIDPKIIAMSEQLSSAFDDYSRSLYDMKDDLDKVADYDANGLRSSVSQVAGSFEKVNKVFEDDVNNAFDIKYFDNLPTLEKASQSENCSNNFANLESLDDENKEKLVQQNKIRDFAISSRCESFLDNTKNSYSVNDDLMSNIEICNDVLSRTVVDKDDSLFSGGVDQKDAYRAQPKIESSLLTDSQDDQDDIEESTTSSISSGT